MPISLELSWDISRLGFVIDFSIVMVRNSCRHFIERSVLFIFNMVIVFSERNMKNYVVIEFENKKIDLVPKNWISIDEKKCCWPTFSKDPAKMKYYKAVKTMAAAQEDWPEYTIIQIMRKYQSGKS